MTDRADERSAVAHYQALYPAYAEFSQRLASLLQTLLESDNIACLLEWRAKAPEHFAEKISRPGKRYSNPLIDVTDLAGVRVIVDSVDSVESAAALIRAEFDVDESRSIDKRRPLGVDRFGYLSQHLIVRLKEPRSSAREWAHLAGFVAEIQVRTALQHAWAQVEHSLVYKAQAALPDELQRRFHAVAAILELADRELNDLIVSARIMIREQAQEIDANRIVELTSLSMIAYLEESDTIRTLKSFVIANGGNIGPLGMVEEAVELAHFAGIRDVSELDRVLVQTLPWAQRFLRLYLEYLLPNTAMSQITTDVSGLVRLLVPAALPELFDERALSRPFAIGEGAGRSLVRAARDAREGLDR